MNQKQKEVKIMKHLEQMEQNSQCSLCGKRYHITAFHGGYVCECCIDYIKTHD